MTGTPATPGIGDAMTEEIVHRVLYVAQPDKINLLGSAATGEMTRDRDTDLLMVEPEPMDRRTEYVRVRQALGGMGHPFGILFIGADRFEASERRHPGACGCGR